MSNDFKEKKKIPNGCRGLAWEAGSQSLSTWGGGGRVGCYGERGRERRAKAESKLDGIARGLPRLTATLPPFPELAPVSGTLLFMMWPNSSLPPDMAEIS